LQNIPRLYWGRNGLLPELIRFLEDCVCIFVRSGGLDQAPVICSKLTYRLEYLVEVIDENIDLCDIERFGHAYMAVEIND